MMNSTRQILLIYQEKFQNLVFQYSKCQNQRKLYMRVAQFLNSISTPQVDTLSSFHCVQRQLSQTLHKVSRSKDPFRPSCNNSSFIKNNQKLMSKTVSNTTHKQLQTVMPCFTKKRNQPYRLINLLCNHKKNQKQQQNNKSFHFMKKNQGNYSTWQQRNRIGQEKRFFRRNYERHTYQHPQNYIVANTQVTNLRKQVAEAMLKHKFCSFFEIQCSGCKCKLQCINHQFEEFLKNADLCILKGLHAIVGRGTNLDAQIKAQIMTLIYQNNNKEFTKTIADKVKEIITMKFGKKVTKKYQSWAKDMYDVVDKVQKYHTKMQKIRNQYKQQRLKQQNNQKKNYKIKKYKSIKLSKFGSKLHSAGSTLDKSKKVEMFQKERSKLKKKTYILIKQPQKTNRSKPKSVVSLKSDNSLNFNPKQSLMLMAQNKRRNRVKKYNSVLQSANRKKMQTLNTQLQEQISGSAQKNQLNEELSKLKQKENQLQTIKNIGQNNNSLLLSLKSRQKVIKQQSQNIINFNFVNYTQNDEKNKLQQQQQYALSQTDNYESQQQFLADERLKQFEILMETKSYRDILQGNHTQLLKNLSQNDLNQNQHINTYKDNIHQNKEKIYNLQTKSPGIASSSNQNRKIRQSHCFGKRKTHNRIGYQQLKQTEKSEENLASPLGPQIQKCYETSLKNLRSWKKIKKQGQTTKKLKKLLSLNQETDTSKILPFQTPSINKIDIQQSKTLRKIIDEIHFKTSIIEIVEKQLCDAGMQQCILCQQDCLLTQKRKATHIRRHIRNGFIKANLNEIEDYLKLFSCKINIKYLEDILKESIKQEKNNQQQDGFINQDELMELLERQKGLKFYNLRYNSHNSSLKQRKQSLIQNCDNLETLLNSIAKLSNDEPINNRQFIGHFESYVTQKQRTPFDFYHYLNVGDNMILRKQMKQKQYVKNSIPSATAGIFLQKQLQRLCKKQVQN